MTEYENLARDALGIGPAEDWSETLAKLRKIAVTYGNIFRATAHSLLASKTAEKFRDMERQAKDLAEFSRYYGPVAEMMTGCPVTDLATPADLSALESSFGKAAAAIEAECPPHDNRSIGRICWGSPGRHLAVECLAVMSRHRTPTAARHDALCAAVAGMADDKFDERIGTLGIEYQCKMARRESLPA